MKRLSRLSPVFLMITFLNSFVYAQETEITILGVTLPGADYNLAVEYLNDIVKPHYWIYEPKNYKIIDIRVENFGLPLPMPTPMTSTGTGETLIQLYNARQDAATHGLRKDADVILYFTGNFTGTEAGVCGWAPNFVWTWRSPNPPGARWNPDPNTGLDLNGSESSFELIIATTGVCDDEPDTAIHEFGHLFGAGHELASSNLDDYLFDNSHAAQAFVLPDDPIQLFYRTIMAVSVEGIRFYPEWSSIKEAGFYANNLDTVRTTAKSVANYRIRTSEPVPDPPPIPLPDPLPPGCSLRTPILLQSVLEGVCDPLPYTHYTVYWGDLCPGASSSYYIEKSQPVGSAWVEFGTTIYNWTPAYITGSDGQLRVRACNSSTCSAPSDPITLTDSC